MSIFTNWKRLFENAEAQRVMVTTRIENVMRYNDALNELEIPPNGDDYNAILELMQGFTFRPPHTEGR